MGEVTSLNNPHLETLKALEQILERAEKIEAQGAIVLLLHGEGKLEVEASHAYPFADLAGYLEAAKFAAALEALSYE